MLTRLLLCLPLIASITAALAQTPAPRPPAAPAPVPPAPAPSAPVQIGPVGGGGQTNGDSHPAKQPCDCCGAKPKYTNQPSWAPFTGTVAFVTQQGPPNTASPLHDQVLVAWDLHIKIGMPINSWWNPSSSPATAYYSHGSWNKTNLGDVFGMTLDNGGNIFLAATSLYGSALGGNLSTGAGQQRMGQIYQISNGSAAPGPFRLLPNSGAGLGNLTYDCERNSLYVSDWDSGLIHQLNNVVGGPTLSTWDHGANLPSAVDATGAPLNPVRAAIPAATRDSTDVRFTALGRRPFAVAVHQNRLYYSIINNRQDLNNGIRNEIWSVALDSTGAALAPARLEIQLPFIAANYSNPVSDITFGPMGDMLVAERSMSGNSSVAAHNSRALGYSFVPGSGWILPNPTAYKIGTFGSQVNSAGGVAIDFSPQGRYVVTGDALHFSGGDYIYGLQGFPPGGGDITNSFLIDADDYPVVINKYQLGVVRIPCPDCEFPPQAPVVTGPQTACSSSAQYSIATPQAGVTYTWTVTGAASTSATTGTSINVNWTGVPGTILVTADGPSTCGKVSTFIKVAACPAKCEFCNQFTRSMSMANPIHQGNGLYSVVPTVTTTMPVTGVSMTLLNSTVAYSPASCGLAGPLASYISQALPSTTTPSINPPNLTVPHGNQANWQSSSSVNISTGATTPMQIQLPQPPIFPPHSCTASFSFCMRASFTDAACRDCDISQCFGPYPYYLIGWPSGIAAQRAPSTDVPLTPAVFESSFLLPLLTFIQNADTNVPQRFPVDDLTFEPNTAALTARSRDLVAQLAAVLTSYPAVELQVEGLSGNSGNEAADQQLGRSRAEAIVSALKSAQVTNRIVTEAKGPFAGATTAIVVLRK